MDIGHNHEHIGLDQSSCRGSPLTNKSLRPRRFKSDWNEIWQHCSSSKYTHRQILRRSDLKRRRSWLFLEEVAPTRRRTRRVAIWDQELIWKWMKLFTDQRS